jgi:hypothetical protein
MTPEEMERAYELFSQWSSTHPGCADAMDWFEDALVRGDVSMYDENSPGSTLTGDWWGCPSSRCLGEIHIKSGLSDGLFKQTVIHESWHEWKNGGTDDFDSEVWEFENNGYCLSW